MSECSLTPCEVTPTLFARQDYVEEAWRIVDPALKAKTPGLRVPKADVGAERSCPGPPPGGWHDPVVGALKAVTNQKETLRTRKAG
jgi:glucose-6-phosphate 1-dehydrogenase